MVSCVSAFSDLTGRGIAGSASSSCRTSGSRDAATTCGPVARDQPALVEHADPVAERERFAHVVRDDDHGLAQAILDAAKLGVQLGAGHRIERAERLVHQQHRRIDRQRARDADALTLAAGQLVRPACRELLRRQSDQVEQLVRARRDALRRPPLEPRHDRDVVARSTCAGTSPTSCIT